MLWSKACSGCLRCKQKMKPAGVLSQNLHQSRKPSHLLPTADKQQRCGLSNLSPLLTPASPLPSIPRTKFHSRLREGDAQGWWANIHFTPSGKLPNGSGHARWHQTCSLYHHLPFTDFDFTKTGLVPVLLTATKTSSSDSQFFSQRRGLVNAGLP